jgi:hypothetical protein
MPEQDPRLRAALENSRRETADAVASLRAMASSIRQEHEKYKRERDKRQEERVKAARQGELGAEAQRLQQRIDLRQTTWEDVLAGRDNHPSAVHARRDMQRNLSAIADRVREDPQLVEADLEARAAQLRLREEMDEEG